MSILDNAIDYVKNAINSASDTVQGWSQEWQNTVDSFKKKAIDFVNRYQRMKERAALAGKDPALKQEYDDLMSKGQWLFDTVAWIAKKLDWVINSTGGNMQALNGMGAAFLVPIAVVAAAIAGMTAWISKAYIVDRKLDFIEGQSGSAGTNTGGLTESLFGESSLFSLNIPPILIWGGLAAGLVYINWDKISKAVGRG